MGLYERLLRIEEPKIPAHQFMAALGEIKRGHVTAQQVATSFELNVDEQTEAATLFARFNDLVDPLTSVELHEVLLLAEQGRAYATVTGLTTRLGV